MKKIIAMNSAEGIFSPLFDSNISDINEYLFSEEDKSDGGIRQRWECCEIYSKSKEFCVKWQGELTLDNYDSLIFFLNFPKYILLSCTADVDGEERILFENVPGDNLPTEPTSKSLLNNKDKVKITNFILKFNNTLSEDKMESVYFYWAGVLASDRIKSIEERLPKYNEASLDGLINYEGNPSTKLNIFFSDNDIEKIKLKKDSNIFKPMLDKLKIEAEKWEDFVPENEIREYVPVAENLYRFTRLRDRNRQPLEEAIKILSIAGYIFENKEWSTLAARMILSIAHTPKWFEGPQGCLEGSTWHHVCFMEDHYMSSIIVSLGFIGNYLTDDGINIVIKSLEKAWKRVNKTSEEIGYRWFMNQGLVGSRGRILGAMMLSKFGYDYEEYIEKSYKDHCLILDNYINDEGHCTEGCDYYDYSFTSSVLIWIVYAKYKNVEVSKVIPSKFLKSIDYVECFMSSIYDSGYFLPLNNSGNKKLSTLLLCFLIDMGGWSKGYEYLLSRVEGDKEDIEDFTGIDILLLISLWPDKIEKSIDNGTSNSKIFEKGGLVSYEFNKDIKGKFWFLAERNPLTGHYHEDRGSIVLEVDNKRVLPDLGILNYSNLTSAYMVKKEYHNLAYPEGLDMNLCDKIAQVSADEAGVGCTTELTMKDFKLPAPKIEKIIEKKDGLEISANIGMVFGEEVVKGIRNIDLRTSSNVEITVEDIWEFKSERSLYINYISYSPWEVLDKQVKTLIDNVEMSIDFKENNNLNYEFIMDNSMSDTDLKKVFILRVKTDKAVEVDFKSNIKVSIVK